MSVISVICIDPIAAILLVHGYINYVAKPWIDDPQGKVVIYADQTPPTATQTQALVDALIQPNDPLKGSIFVSAEVRSHLHQLLTPASLAQLCGKIIAVADGIESIQIGDPSAELFFPSELDTAVNEFSDGRYALSFLNLKSLPEPLKRPSNSNHIWPIQGDAELERAIAKLERPPGLDTDPSNVVHMTFGSGNFIPPDPKPAAKTVEFSNGSNADYQLLKELIETRNTLLGFLVNTPIKIILRFKAKHRKGRRVLGTASVFQPKDRLIHGWDALIELDWTFWEANPDKREALLFHELCHFHYDDDQQKLITVGHDIEEFTAVLKYYGDWNDDLTQVKQLNLFQQTA